MKIRAHNELVFTVFFGQENASKRMQNVFEETYNGINKAFTRIQPKAMYDGELKEHMIYDEKPQENIITWN